MTVIAISMVKKTVYQWSSNLAHKINFPEEFSSNRDQIHLWFSNDPEDND